MNTTAKGMLRSIATRSVIAAIPVAMATAYASNLTVPTPPRLAQYAIQPVAEITVSPTTVGIAASQLYGETPAQINAQLDQMQAIGVTSIRVFVPWGLVEVAPDVYNWSLIDNVMAAAAERNMGVMAEVNATPLWVAQGFPLGSPTPDPAQYADFLKAFIAHQVTVQGQSVSYGSIVSAYEVWNEPNFAAFFNPISPEAYADLVKAASAVIKNPVYGDPTASVVIGAVGTVQTDPFFNSTLDTVQFVQRMFAALGPNAGQYFDALSIHPYGQETEFSGTCPTCAPGILTPREQFEAIAAMEQLTGKKIWISEYGIPSTPGGPFSEQDQAKWDKDLLDTWNAYANPNSTYYDPKIAALLGPIFLYTGQDTPGANGVNNPEDYYGLWDENGQLKPAGQMLKDWLAALNPTNPTNPGTPTDPFAQIAQQLAQLAQQLAVFNQQLLAFAQQVNAFAVALQNWAASFNPPAAPTVNALAMKVAAVDDPSGSVLKTAALDAVDQQGKASGTDAEVAADAEKVGTEAADPQAAADLVKTPASELTPATATTPEVTDPTTTPPVTDPSTTPPVTTPATTPPVTTPPATTPPATTPPATTPPKDTTPSTPSNSTDPGTSNASNGSGTSNGSGASGSGKDDQGKGSKPGGGDAANGGTSHGDRPNTGGTGKTKAGGDTSGPGSSSGHESGGPSRQGRPGRDGAPAAAADPKPKTESNGTSAPGAERPASERAGAAAS